MIDVDARGDENNIQIISGRDRGDRSFTEAAALTITLLVEFTQVVELLEPEDSTNGCD